MNVMTMNLSENIAEQNAPAELNGMVPLTLEQPPAEILAKVNALLSVTVETEAPSDTVSSKKNSKTKVLPLWLELSGLVLLDQTLLPHETLYWRLSSVEAVAVAIETMIVRGAPAIGVSAAYGLVLSVRQWIEEGQSTLDGYEHRFQKDYERLLNTRPTAVNLSWALAEMKHVFETAYSPSFFQESGSAQILANDWAEKAWAIHQADILACKAMGDFGATLMPAGARILTHCNAGALATGAYGTALGVVRSAFQNDATVQVFSDETRPRFQGGRLTTWELLQDGIPVTLIADNMAASLMQAGKIDCVVVGADRITANGDVANKIGTYGLALVAKAHQIPFYVAAPQSTFDLSLASGHQIPIESRNADEVDVIHGQKLSAEGTQFLNPGFDVTPHGLITAIITEKGIIRGDYQETIAQTLL